MSAALLIARRELGAYFRSLSGYVIIAIFLLIDGLVFNTWALGGTDKHSAEVLSTFFYLSSGLSAIGPAVLLSMRLVAEERQSGTIDLLYSSPVRDGEIIVGKYLSALAFLAFSLALTFYMPLLIKVNGKISPGHIAAGYLGLLLLGSATLAIGIFGSALARSQMMALVISAGITAGMIVCWNLAKVSERPLNDIFSALALWNVHFPPFESGLIHLRDVVYFVAVTYFFLFCATRVLEARRWR